ncbi:hypothetical protein DIPPA_02836 [Diplonema papillatum]|nr:hypothetical protein DIPPA_02836 [Diplonema papillatum]
MMRPGGRTAGRSSQYGQENVRMLTPDLFSSVGKRKKILQSSAMRHNNSHTLYQLDKSFRFYCSASGKWEIADEVAYDERHGTFQSAREYQRTVRPKNGVKQKFNFWPQLGVGDVKYKELAAPPSNPFQNPAAAFIPSGKRVVDRSNPEQRRMPAPSMLPPAAGRHAQQQGYAAHGAQARDEYFEDHPAAAAREAMLPFSDTFSAGRTRSEIGMFDSTTVGDHSTVYDDAATERTERGLLFDPTEATSFQGDKTSVYEATDHGSAVDFTDALQRQRDALANVVESDRVAKIAAIAGVTRYPFRRLLRGNEPVRVPTLLFL